MKIKKSILTVFWLCGSRWNKQLQCTSIHSITDI